MTIEEPGNQDYVIAIIALSSILGILFVLPIGGADMPVVVSLLNSLSGIAAAFTGFIIGNNVLIIAGSMVGAAGVLAIGVCIGFGSFWAASRVHCSELSRGGIITDTPTIIIFIPKHLRIDSATRAE